MEMTAHRASPNQLKFVEDFKKISNDLGTVELISIMSMILGQIIGSTAIGEEGIQLGIGIIQRNVEEGIKEGLLNRAQPRGNA